ncbi:MAG: hypothetical protein U5K33_09135 [Halofilum sp. (in: g-proteobacteria)]|nr:hypothetical protein [Halofilum sp. (in: g-proteobacteria)]
MSEEQELQLSIDMVRDIQARLKENDERAADPGVSAQYLAAVIGFLLGQIKADTDDKKEFLRQLTDFAAGVIDDVEAQQEMQSAQPGGGAAAGGSHDDEPASGIWTPDQK